MSKNLNPVSNVVLGSESKGIIHLLPLLVIALILIFGVGYYAYKNKQIKTIVQTDPSSPSLYDAWKDQITPTPIPSEVLNSKCIKDSDCQNICEACIEGVCQYQLGCHPLPDELKYCNYDADCPSGYSCDSNSKLCLKL